MRNLIAVCCLSVVVIATPQYSFLPSYSYSSVDPLLSSPSISTSSFLPSNSLNYVQQQQPSFPQTRESGIGSLLERVIAEATEYVENGELPVHTNHSAAHMRKRLT